jgi:hypothetical protein
MYQYFLLRKGENFSKEEVQVAECIILENGYHKATHQDRAYSSIEGIEDLIEDGNCGDVAFIGLDRITLEYKKNLLDPDLVEELEGRIEGLKLYDDSLEEVRSQRTLPTTIITGGPPNGLKQ